MTSKSLQLAYEYAVLDGVTKDVLEFHKPFDDLLEAWSGLSCYISHSFKWLADARDLKRWLTLDAVRMFPGVENHATIANNAFKTIAASSRTVSIKTAAESIFFGDSGDYTDGIYDPKKILDYKVANDELIYWLEQSL